MRDAHALLSTAISIMHPKMYALGRESLIKQWKWASKTEHGQMLDILQLWPSVYNTTSLMVNSCSPYHVDINGRAELYDQLLTVEQYKGLDMVFPCQKLRLRYEAGSMIVSSGWLLVHGAREVAGDRACLAWYMQHKVHSAFEIPDCKFVTLQKV